MICRVKGCTYPNTHTTRGHKCSLCNRYGHGKFECNNRKQICKLRPFLNEKLDEKYWCSIPNCKLFKYHINEAHYCQKCGQLHSEKDCIIMSIKELKNILYHQNLNHDFDKLLSIHNDIYLDFQFDTESKIYIVKKNYEVYSIFMYNDWFENNNINLDLFKKHTQNLNYLGDIDNLILEDIKTDIECPLCRTLNNVSQILAIKGSDEQCKVCLDNTVTKFFSKCGHGCVCDRCYKELLKIRN